ncbi:MAG TPA: glycosyltransferase family 39 protein [Candidatus Sulfotelmatobacter sp.]|nr:glycosyltransferase family 39 protein [Candidatus Sulfotelmatobacter sp.]
MQASQAVNSAESPISKPESTVLFTWAAVLLLSAAALAIRLWCIACKPFWFDECFSVEIARISWGNFFHLLWWREANMSLYYLLLRIWLHFGESPFFIRSLSAVIGAGTVPVVYWLAKLLFDRRVALITAALFAFNAYDVRYSQEARSYVLFVLLATVSSGFLIAWLRNPTPRNRAWYIVFSVLAVYAHFYALLLIAAHWLAVRLRTGEDKRASDDLRRAWITIAIAVSPLLVFVAKTGAGPIKWIQRPEFGDLLQFFEHISGSNGWELLAVVVIACGFAIAPSASKLFERNQGRDVWRCQFLLIWLLFPVVLTVILSFARPVFLARYMIFCLPPLLILAAAGIARLRRAWAVGAAAAVALLLASQGTLFVYGHDFDQERDASEAATNFILDHAQPGDAILFHIAETRIPYEFFRSLRAGENTASPEYKGQLGPKVLFPNHGPGLDYRDFTGKPTADFVRSTAPQHSRIWVMLMNNGPAGKPDPTTAMLTQILLETFPRVERWEFAKVEVLLYSK